MGYNYHHLIPRTRGGQSIDSNLCFIKINKHHAYHRLFGNSTPKQIIKMLENFERDFNLVFGKVTMKEASAIIARLIQFKQNQYDDYT